MDCCRQLIISRGALLKYKDGNIRHLAEFTSASLTDEETELMLAFSAYFEPNNWIIDVDELGTRPFFYEGLKANHALLN
jgi:hypothetical protein